MNFDLSTAIRCAKAIQAMYAGDLAANLVAEATDTQVRIQEAHHGEFFIFIPGSASRRDWRTNRQILKSGWVDGFVHRGFKDAFHSVSAQLWERVRDARSVTIAGHSLGGALATLCADYLTTFARCDFVSGVYTFGSPRVGNRTFARNYNSALGALTFRVVNAGDPVPWLPFPLCSLRTGIYTHVDHLVYLNRSGGVDANLALVAGREVLARLNPETEVVNREMVAVSSHFLSAYILKLEQLT